MDSPSEALTSIIWEPRLSDAGDINNDGVADLLVGSSNTGAFAVFGHRNIGSSGSVDIAAIRDAGSDAVVFFI